MLLVSHFQTKGCDGCGVCAMHPPQPVRPDDLTSNQSYEPRKPPGGFVSTDKPNTTIYTRHPTVPQGRYDQNIKKNIKWRLCERVRTCCFCLPLLRSCHSKTQSSADARTCIFLHVCMFHSVASPR